MTRLPKTGLGKISISLLVLFIIFTGLSTIFSFTTNMHDVINLLAISGLIVSAGAVITSLVAILRQHERNIWVYLAAIVGIIVLAFLLAELLLS